MHAFSARAVSAAALIALFFTTSIPALAAVTGVVRGTVTVHNAPAAGITVTLRGAQTTLSATTNDKGEYAFPLVPFGRYTITAHFDGHPDATATVEVASDSVST